MSAWVLVLLYGISGWGAGGVRHIEFSSKDECYEALAAMRIEATVQTAGEDDEQVIAFCRPATPEG